MSTPSHETEWGDDAHPLEERSSVALFSGDEGGLSLDQRRCLVKLLKERYLSRDTHPDLWEVLVRNEDVLRARLNDVFLTLHVDLEAEVAYKRQASPDETDRRFPTLLHDTAYNREETILLVYLRERAQRERAAGADSVLVDRDELVERVAEFRRPDATDLAGDARRASSAIDALRSMGVLHTTREDDRFAVSRVLDSLMPLPRLKELLEWLRSDTGAMPEAHDSSDDSGDADDGGEGE
jgi:hypothetical protein